MSTAPNNGADRKLPSRRISFKNQVELLRSYAAASGQDQKPVSIGEAAELAGMASSSASLTNSFFLDVGLLERSGKQFIPSSAVTSFWHVSQWNSETAGSELAPLLRKSWFATALTPKLSLGSMPKSDVILELSKAAGVTPNQQSELEMLIDYLVFAGVVVEDGGMISLPRSSTRAAGAPPSEGEKEAAVEATPARAAMPSSPSTRSQVPMLIQGLLQELPSDGHWTHAKAEKWLEMAKLTFELVYTFDDAAPQHPTFPPASPLGEAETE